MKLIAKISILLAATCFMVASCDPADEPEGPDIVVPPTPEPGPEPTPKPDPTPEPEPNPDPTPTPDPDPTPGTSLYPWA